MRKKNYNITAMWYVMDMDLESGDYTNRSIRVTTLTRNIWLVIDINEWVLTINFMS